MDNLHALVLIAYGLVVAASFTASMRMDSAVRFPDDWNPWSSATLDEDRFRPGNKLHPWAVSFWLGLAVFLWFVGVDVPGILLQLSALALLPFLYFYFRAEERAPWLKRVPTALRVSTLIVFSLGFAFTATYFIWLRT